MVEEIRDTKDVFDLKLKYTMLVTTHTQESDAVQHGGPGQPHHGARVPADPNQTFYMIGRASTML